MTKIAESKGYYDELFLHHSPSKTCQLPLVLVMDKDDYIDFFQTITKDPLA